MGGYVAANADIIDYIRSFAPGFIFTSSMNPSIAAASITSIKIAMSSEELRDNIRINSDLIRLGLRDLRIPFLENQRPNSALPLLNTSLPQSSKFYFSFRY